MGKKILVVDDEPGIIKVMKRLLELYQFEVITASGGFEAFEIIKNNHQDISFIISDMRMSGGNGLQLLDSLNKDEFKIPFLLVTGFADVSVSEAINKGALGIMTKPLNMDQLLETINSHVK